MSTNYGLGHQTVGVAAADEAYPGLVRDLRASDSYANAQATTRQTYVIALGTAANGAVYTITAGGYPVAYTADGSATLAEIKAGLIAAWRNNADAGQYFSIADTGAAELTLTHRDYGINTPVTISGGDAAGTNTAATTSATLPFGRVVTVGSDAVGTDGLGSVRLPSASGQIVAGVTIASHAIPREGTPPNETSGYRAQDTVSVAKQADIWATAEAAFSAADGQVFFRHTADGALTILGAISPATGTGLQELLGARVQRPSVLLPDGTHAVLLTINIP
jgi:hypothetical protein